MRKITFLLFILFSIVYCNAQTQFEGNIKTVVKTTNGTVDNILKMLDEKITDPLAKAAAKNIMIKNFKRAEEERFINGCPDGTITTYSKVKGNRIIQFCPDLGRIILIDGDEGDFYCAFPKMKVAMRIGVAAQNFKKSYTKEENPKMGDDVIEVDGYKCRKSFALFQYDAIGGDLVDTVTIRDTLYVKVTTEGLTLVEYPNLAKLVVVINDYIEQSMDMKSMTPCEIDEVNFTFPSDYVILPKDKLRKKLQKALNDGSLKINFDGVPPNSFWDIK